MLQRRHCRQLGRRGVRDPSSGSLTYQQILGPLLVEMWHSQFGTGLVAATIDTWTGQLRSTVLQAPAAINRPDYIADGSRFGGKPVVQTAVAGAKCLAVAGIPTLLANGSRPCVYTRMRYRSAVSAANETICDFGVLATSDDFDLRTDIAGTSFEYFGSGASVLQASYNNNVRSVAAWADGTNKNLLIDGVLSQQATVSALGHDITAVGVGRTASTAGVQIGTTSNALILVMSAYPGAAALAAVTRVAELEFPA